MTVTQIHTLMNIVTTEVLGSAIIAEDLSNVVDIGTELFNASAVDNYVRSLVNHIGRLIFVNRPYAGNVPSVLMDGWEYGSVLEKITAEMPAAVENESWELADGETYNPNIFYKPQVSAKFFNQRVTFEIPMSFTERQIKESFSNAEQLNGFLSMIYNAIDKSMTVKVDSLVMRTINSMIGETLASDFPGGVYSGGTGVKAVNLLYKYNQKFGTNIDIDQAMTEAAFLRYAAYEIGMYMSRMTKLSSLFNVGGKDRFTPLDYMHVVMLADFKKAADVYLQSDVFHNDFTQLPGAETVPYWQGSGTTYGLNDVSTINIKTPSGKTVNTPGILAVMFDRDALGVTNLDRRVTTNYNAKAEFYNNWFKFDAGYFNDLNENFVVFYAA